MATRIRRRRASGFSPSNIGTMITYFPWRASLWPSFHGELAPASQKPAPFLLRIRTDAGKYNRHGIIQLMIPLRLRIAGFLSYREPVEIDFTSFDLACISGHNGAGKSSLLDAITWALFGQARRRDEALINLQSKTAEVAFTFQYEDSIYRVQRALPRGKNGILEFQLLDLGGAVGQLNLQHNGGGNHARIQLPDNPVWRPLTERTLRDTQACIEEALRLDYETFVNASFFLQGKADQFTQQTAGKRKDVLGSILGLEVWEEYKTRAADRRKGFENDLEILERRIAEIDTELAEDGPRKQRLAELETQLAQLSAAVSAQPLRVFGRPRPQSINSANSSRCSVPTCTGPVLSGRRSVTGSPNGMR